MALKGFGLCLALTAPTALGCAAEDASDEPLEEVAATEDGTHSESPNADEGDPDGQRMGPECEGSDAPGTLRWVTSFNGTNALTSSGLSRLMSSDDGRLVAAGENAGAGWVAKLTSERQLLWQTTVGSGCTATALADGGVMAGCTIAQGCSGDTFHECNNDISFRRYDAQGQVMWQDEISSLPEGGNDRTLGEYIETDSGEIIVAYTFSIAGSSGDSDRSHLRAYSSTGELVWDREVSLDGNSPTSITLSLIGDAAQHVLYAQGTVTGVSQVVKFDMAGGVQWVRLAEGDRHFSRIATYNGGVAAVGTDKSGTTLVGLLQLFDPSGNVRLTKHFESERGGRAIANAVATSESGRIFVAINDEDGGEGLSRAYVVELTADGEQVWRTTGFGPIHTSIVGLSIANGCSLLVAGSTWEEVSGQRADFGLGAELSL